jgi:HEAT repeat protein
LPFASSNNQEIRIKTARAISRLELPESLPVLRRLAQDLAWEVQTQAMLGLGRLKNAQAILVLCEALCSPYWYVRLNAKEALLLMGEIGIACLKKMSDQTEDRFAADMAKMGLREYQELYEKI